MVILNLESHRSKSGSDLYYNLLHSPFPQRVTEEKLEEAKRQVEESAQVAQKFWLHNRKPMRLALPKGEALTNAMIGSILSLAAALVLKYKLRKRRA